MRISKETIETYLKKSDELGKIQKRLSDLIIDAKKNKDEKVSFMRKNDKGELIKVDFTEATLWEEIWHLGNKAGQARNYLMGKYPKVFEVADKEKEMATEVKRYALENFGVDTRAMRLSDIIKVIIGVVESYKRK